MEIKISAENTQRYAIYEILQDNIDILSSQIDSKVSGFSSSNASITVDNTHPRSPMIKANIRSENGQIIKLNGDGLYAKAELTYNEENNVLNFTNTNGTSTIELKTKSQIDNIYYDKPNEEIVIEYTVNGSRKEDVRVPVGDLIEEWRTEDGNVGAIQLIKERNVSSEDVLKARLVLNTVHDDNIAVIDDNALYVSKNALLSELHAEIAALEARIAALESSNGTNSHGLNTDSTIQDLIDYVDNQP